MQKLNPPVYCNKCKSLAVFGRVQKQHNGTTLIMCDDCVSSFLTWLFESGLVDSHRFKQYIDMELELTPV